MNTTIDEYWSHNPTRFRFLESFCLSRVIADHAAAPFTLVLTLLSAPQLHAERAQMTFRGVRGLDIGAVEGLTGLVVEVSDVGARQMEGCRFRVVESENGCFEFYCFDFDLKLLA